MSNQRQGVKTVQWLGTSEPPLALVTHLRMRGLSLRENEPAEPMQAARMLVVEPATSAVVRGPSLAGRRVAVMHPDPGAADALAQALRAKGADVVALSLNPDSLERAEALDPDVVLMEPADFYGSCWEIVRALWQHPRLRYATVMLASAEPEGPDGASALDVQNLCVAIQAASTEYDRVRDEAGKTGELKLTLDVLGPARTLRALLESKRSLRVRFSCPDLTVEVDLSDEIIVGAQGGLGSELTDTHLGPHALAVLMQQHEGQGLVRAVDHPAATNIMAPFETALHTARESLLAGRPSGVRFSAVAISPRAPQATPRNGWTAPTNTDAPPARSPTPAPPNTQVVPAPSRFRKTLTPTGAQLPLTKPTILPARAEPAPLPMPQLAPVATQARVAPAMPAPGLLLSRVNAEPGALRKPRPHSPTGSLPLTVTALGVDADDAFARAAARVDNVVTKSKDPPSATTRTGTPAPNVLTQDAERVVAVASLPPRAPTQTEQAEMEAEPLHVPRPAPPQSQLPSSEPQHSPAPNLTFPFAHDILNAHGDVPEPSSEEGDAQLAIETARHLLSRPLARKRGAWLLASAAALGLLWLGAAALGLPGSTDQPVAGAASTTSTTSGTSGAKGASPTESAAAAVAAAARAAPSAPAVPMAVPAGARGLDQAEDDGEQQELSAQQQLPEESDVSRRARAKRASALVSQGHSFRRRGLLPTAKLRYFEALREYPGYPRAIAGLVQLSIASDDGAQAVSYARRLVHARPTQVDYLVLLGDAYKSAGMLAQARETWQNAAKRGSRPARKRLGNM